MNKEFEQGYDAFLDYQNSVLSNPYELGTEWSDNWLAGYYAAFSDSIPAYDAD